MFLFEYINLAMDFASVFVLKERKHQTTKKWAVALEMWELTNIDIRKSIVSPGIVLVSGY